MYTSFPKISTRTATKFVVGFLLSIILSISGIVMAAADSSSPLLAAYYDRQMAIVGGAVYTWTGNAAPTRLPFKAVQVGVGRNVQYLLTAEGVLLGFRDDPERSERLMSRVAKFYAGQDGVLAIKEDGTLWWIAGFAGDKRIIASDVATATVGDGTNYYITKSGALFVKGRANRGQYGDGRLKTTVGFVQTASQAVQIAAHTGHAILLKKNGDVMGTGGNIFGPVGKYGLGDKAVRWSRIMSGASAIATGASHSVAILADGTLMAWGSEYGPEPVPVMSGVIAVAAGSSTTIALKKDLTLWQWDRGEKPSQLPLK